jgi:hypothetical protein
MMKAIGRITSTGLGDQDHQSLVAVLTVADNPDDSQSSDMFEAPKDFISRMDIQAMPVQVSGISRDLSENSGFFHKALGSPAG